MCLSGINVSLPHPSLPLSKYQWGEVRINKKIKKVISMIIPIDYVLSDKEGRRKSWLTLIERICFDKVGILKVTGVCCHHCHVSFNHPEGLLSKISSGPGELHSDSETHHFCMGRLTGLGLRWRDTAGFFLTGKRSAHAGFPVFICPFIHPSIHSFIHSIHSPIHASICPSIYSFTHPSIHFIH